MITQKQYQEFMEHYSWQLLKSPDYRLGQAFLNYFPEASKRLANTDGAILETKLYYEADNERAKSIIDQWVSVLDQ
jgi:hypothetical protein